MTDIPGDEAPKRISNMQEFQSYVKDGTRGYLDSVPIAAMAAWFGPGGSQMYFQPLGQFQIDPYSTPIAIFHDDNVIRVYTLPSKVPDPKPAVWTDRRPRRYTFTKTAPTYVVEEMDLQLMADEIIDEWVVLAEATSSAEAELDKVIQWITDEKPATIADIIVGLHEGAHRMTDDDGDEEEEDDDASGGGNVTPPPAPQTPPAH